MLMLLLLNTEDCSSPKIFELRIPAESCVSGLPKSFDSLTPEIFDWLMSRSETPEINDFL